MASRPHGILMILKLLAIDAAKFRAGLRKRAQAVALQLTGSGWVEG